MANFASKYAFKSHFIVQKLLRDCENLQILLVEHFVELNKLVTDTCIPNIRGYC